MSIRGDLYLGVTGSEVLLSPFGRRISIKPTETTRERRTIDGTLKKDKMYLKYTFSLSYDEIFGNDLQTYLDLYDLQQELNFIIYFNDNTPSNFSVYMKPLSRKRDILLGDGIYKSVNVQLTEA